MMMETTTAALTFCALSCVGFFTTPTKQKKKENPNQQPKIDRELYLFCVNLEIFPAALEKRSYCVRIFLQWDPLLNSP